MKIGILLIAILALQKTVDADEKRCYAQAMCEFPSKNETKLSHVQVYPYPTCGKETLITVVNESYTESIMDFMKKLRKQLVEKKCLSNLSADTEDQKTKEDKGDKCYSPVICNQKEKAEPRWTQIQPFPHCDETSLQDLRQLFDESKNETIKKIENLLVDSSCCQEKVNTTIERLKSNNWTLSEEDAEDCFMPVYCHYATGVSDNWMRFYPEKCKSLVSVQQAVNAFDSVLDDVQKDFASEIKEECDVSTTSKMTRTETTSAQTTAKVTIINTKPSAPEKVTNLKAQVNGTSFTPSWSTRTETTSAQTTAKVTIINTKPSAPEKVTNRKVQVNGTSFTPSWSSSWSTHTVTTSAQTTTKEVAIANTRSSAPEKVANLMVQVNGTSLTPSWSSATGVTSHEIEIKIGSTSILKISNAISGKEITNDAIEPATMYNISIVAVIGSLRSDAKTTSFNTTFNAPKVTIDEVLQNTFQLSWSEVNGNSSYEYKCTPRDSDYISTSNKSVEIDKLTANTEYTCSVRATNGSIKGNSEFAAQTTCPTYDRTTPGCNAAYNGTCFKFVANGTVQTLTAAAQSCKDGFQLGNITDACMFNALKKYHEDEKFGGNGKNYWTRSTITPKDVADFGKNTGYISKAWGTNRDPGPEKGQHVLIRGKYFTRELDFKILAFPRTQNDGKENKGHGAFCVKVRN